MRRSARRGKTVYLDQFRIWWGPDSETIRLSVPDEAGRFITTVKNKPGRTR